MAKDWTSVQALNEKGEPETMPRWRADEIRKAEQEREEWARNHRRNHRERALQDLRSARWSLKTNLARGTEGDWTEEQTAEVREAVRMLSAISARIVSAFPVERKPRKPTWKRWLVRDLCALGDGREVWIEEIVKARSLDELTDLLEGRVPVVEREGVPRPVERVIRTEEPKVVG